MRILHANPHKQCAVTGRTDRIELHHILSRAQGGSDTRENLVFLTAEFHQRVTVNDPVALRLLGEHIASERPDVIAYLYSKLGEGAFSWMQRRLYIGVE